MTFTITMPTKEDLATLPIVDLMPNGICNPSNFNEPDPGLSFVDSSFDPPYLAQMVAMALIITPLQQELHLMQRRIQANPR